MKWLSNLKLFTLNTEIILQSKPALVLSSIDQRNHKIIVTLILLAIL